MTTRRARKPKSQLPLQRRTGAGHRNKWQKIWDEQGTFWAANVNGDLKDGKGRNAEGRTAYFAMDMFPYPSGKVCMWATRWVIWPPM